MSLTLLKTTIIKAFEAQMENVFVSAGRTTYSGDTNEILEIIGLIYESKGDQQNIGSFVYNVGGLKTDVTMRELAVRATADVSSFIDLVISEIEGNEGK
jgi:hypothetical protein